MITRWLWAASLVGMTMQGPVSSRIEGVVRDVKDYPIPGAIVSIAGDGIRAQRVTDPRGAFSLADLPDGRYLVTFTIAGFRPRTEPVVVGGDRRVARLNVTLAVAPIATILWIVPPKPVQEADAIAHIRILGTAASAPCSYAVSAFHDVEVLASVKGSPEARTVLAQEGAGVCVDTDGKRYEGTEEPYRVGDEYIVFLRRGETSFGRLAGPSLTFAVAGGRVGTRGFAGLPADVTVATFLDTLKKLR